MTQKEFSEKKMNNVISQATEWSSEFKASALFKTLTTSAQANSDNITFAFSEQMYREERRAGREWTAASLETILTTVFPKELSDYPTVKQDISEVLTNYFTFLKAEKKISNAETLNRKLATLSFVEDASTVKPKTEAKVKNAPVAKVKATKETTTYSQNEIERFNQFVMGSVLTEIRSGSKPKEEPVKTETKLVGRNELCPCGSGKKFKKCHGK